MYRAVQFAMSGESRVLWHHRDRDKVSRYREVMEKRFPFMDIKVVEAEW